MINLLPLLVSLLALVVRGALSPHHCYDFLSTSVQDSCGAAHLTLHCKCFSLTLASNYSPVCEESGCHFFNGASHFSLPVPSGMASTWTLALWVREVFSSSATYFALAYVGPY